MKAPEQDQKAWRRGDVITISPLKQAIDDDALRDAAAEGDRKPYVNAIEVEMHMRRRGMRYVSPDTIEVFLPSSSKSRTSRGRLHAPTLVAAAYRAFHPAQTATPE